MIFGIYYFSTDNSWEWFETDKFQKGLNAGRICPILPPHIIEYIKNAKAGIGPRGPDPVIIKE